MHKLINLACYFYSQTNWHHGIFWTSPLGAVNVSTKILFSAIIMFLQNPKQGSCGIAITNAEERAIRRHSDYIVVPPSGKIIIALSYLLVLPVLCLVAPFMQMKVKRCHLPNYQKLRLINSYALSIMILAGLLVGHLLKRRFTTFVLSSDHCPLILSIGYTVKHNELHYVPHGWNFGEDNEDRIKSIFSKVIVRDTIQKKYFKKIYKKGTCILLDTKVDLEPIFPDEASLDEDGSLCIWLSQMDFFNHKIAQTHAAVASMIKQNGEVNTRKIFISVKTKAQINKFKKHFNDNEMEIQGLDRTRLMCAKNFVINSSVSYDILKQLGAVYVSSQNILVADTDLKQVMAEKGYIIRNVRDGVYLVTQNSKNKIHKIDGE